MCVLTVDILYGVGPLGLLAVDILYGVGHMSFNCWHSVWSRTCVF